MTGLNHYFKSVYIGFMVLALMSFGCSADSEGEPADLFESSGGSIDTGILPSKLLISIVTRNALNKDQRIYGSTASVSIGTELANGSLSSHYTESKPDTNPMGAQDGIIDFETTTEYLYGGKTLIAEVSATGFDNLTVKYKLSPADPSLIRWPSQYSLVIYCYMNPI